MDCDLGWNGCYLFLAFIVLGLLGERKHPVMVVSKPAVHTSGRVGSINFANGGDQRRRYSNITKQSTNHYKFNRLGYRIEDQEHDCYLVGRYGFALGIRKCY